MTTSKPLNSSELSEQIVNLLHKHDHEPDEITKYVVIDQTELVPDLIALIAKHTQEAETQMQIDDREVMLGWMEANQDNLSVQEIIATIKGQLLTLEQELATLKSKTGDK